MFVKHINKTLHVSVTIVSPSSGARLSCLVLLLLLCLFASSSCLFGMWLYVVYVCACLMYLSVGYLVVKSQPNIPQTSTPSTHTHRQHTATHCEITNIPQTGTSGTHTHRQHTATHTVKSQPNIPQTSTSGTHTHRQHKATHCEITTKHPTDKYIRHAHT